MSRTPPPPATDEREAVAVAALINALKQAGGYPATISHLKSGKFSDSISVHIAIAAIMDARAAEILAAEAVARALCRDQIIRMGSHKVESAIAAFVEQHWRGHLLAADAARSALAPIRAQEIAAARAEEQGYRHTQVAALKQVHAAEILAAEANERARIVASLRATSTGLDLTKRRIADAIERNEHGAGK